MQDTPLTDLETIQSIPERTRTITVTERVVAKDQGVIAEVECQTTVFIRPLPFRRWLTALGLVKSALAKLPGGSIDFDSEMNIAVWVAEMLGAIPDELIGLASLATDKKEEFFDRIELDEGIQIIKAVIEVNKDFFVLKVLPLISTLAPEVKESLTETFGQTE